jgi:hypothetical protein
MNGSGREIVKLFFRKPIAVFAYSPKTVALSMRDVQVRPELSLKRVISRSKG